MKNLILAVLVLNSVSLLAAGLGEKEESDCTAGNQTARVRESIKEDKKIEPKVETETKTR